MRASRAIVRGEADGPVRHADLGLSFWGGVDAATGIVTDERHPLHGQSLAGAIVAIPSGRGSCTASGVLLELLKGGRGPAALIFREEEQILTLGVLAAREIFDASIPVLQLSAEDFARVGAWRRARITAHALVGDDRFVIPLPDEPPGRSLNLSDRDRALLAGREGAARRIAMRIIVELAQAFGAADLIDVTRAHLDCCIHTGPASVEIAERLRDVGGRFTVPTTLNAISTDLANWRSFGLDPVVAAASERQASAYLAMGAAPTFTCAPYLHAAPKLGEQIAWAESNAVAYANSVLGARTQKYPDYLDLCIALTGRAPLSGCHKAEGRLATAVISIGEIVDFDDAFYPLFGYLAGLLSPNAIPAITGLERADPTLDDLKAFAAAFATTSAAPMFHIVGVTPEAGTLADALGGRAAETIGVGRADLRRAWLDLNGTSDEPIGLIAVGNPHASAAELGRFADLMEGRVKAANVDVVVTTSRAVLAEIAPSGVQGRLERFGVRFIADTCWCMLEKPIAPPAAGAVITNSGKYAHYGPNLVGGPFRFGSLADCVDAACRPAAPHRLPVWLQD